MGIAVIGLDIAKTWFQIHGVDESGQTVLRRKLRRDQVIAFFAKIETCLVGMEACGGSSFWAREIAKLGHSVKIMPARYVRPYVKTNKHDPADAEACCEAVQRPAMRFVPIKTEEQHSVMMVHRVRDLLARQRTAAVNAFRGHLSEFGIVAAKGKARLNDLMHVALTSDRIPELAREMLGHLIRQIQDIEQKLDLLEKRLIDRAKSNEACRRLMTILNVGPITASAVVATVGDASQFKTGRHLAAWLGIVPKQHSTGGREKLGGISKRGDKYLRKLLIHGARAAVHRVRSNKVANAWVSSLLQRRHYNTVTVALANKTARVIWAVLTRGQEFRPAGTPVR